MVRADIVIAMKNSIERGYSLEQSAQSLFNAGYSQNDIYEAINYLTSGIGNVGNYYQQNSDNQNSQTQKSLNQNEPVDEKSEDDKNSESSQEGYKSNFVSGNYGEVKKNPYQNNVLQKSLKQKKSKFISGKFIALISLLAFFVLILIFVLIFRDNLTSFLDKLTG